MMGTTDILFQLQTHVAPLVGAARAEDVAPDKYPHELGLDSMGLVDLLVFIEKTFGIPLLSSGLRQEDLTSLTTLAQKIAAYADRATTGEHV